MKKLLLLAPLILAAGCNTINEGPRNSGATGSGTLMTLPVVPSGTPAPNAVTPTVTSVPSAARPAVNIKPAVGPTQIISPTPAQ